MRIRFGRLTLVVLAAVAAVALSTLAVAPPAGGDQHLDAKTLFVETHKCNMCHGVAAEGIEAKTSSEKMKGPDLSGYKSEKDLADIAAYVRKAADIEGKSHTKEFKGTDEELQAIVDWLGSLEAQK